MYFKPEFIISLQEKANRQNCELSVTIDRSLDAPDKIRLRLDANEMNAHVEKVWLEEELDRSLSLEDVLRREVARMIGQIQERRYKINDIRTAQQLCDRFAYNKIPPIKKVLLPEIKDVIFNDPATIVMWSDGTKTVVKAENESYDPEKGLAMAISKRALGNQGNYFNTFKKWLPKELSAEEVEELGKAFATGFSDGIEFPHPAATKAAAKIAESLHKVTEQLGIKGSEALKQRVSEPDDE